MNENLIIQTLKKATQEWELYFQIIQEENILHIFINRAAESQLDYAQVTETVLSALATLQIPNLEGLWLYSRIMGTVEPDWETFVEFSDSPVSDSHIGTKNEAQVESQLTENQTAQTSVSDSHIETENEVQVESQLTLEDEEALLSTDLSENCFIRNKSLLSADILPPSLTVSHLLQFFHNLSDLEKRKIIPVLKQLFESSEELAIEKFSSSVKEWLERIAKLNNSDLRKASIWLSRYCFNPSETMSRVKIVFDAEAAKAAYNNPQPEEVKNNKPLEIPPIINSDLPSSLIGTTNATKIYVAPSQTSGSLRKNKASLPEWLNVILPIGWALFTFIVILLGINSVKAESVRSPLCKNYTNSPNYCQLAVQIIGQPVLESFSKGAEPITEEVKFKGQDFCDRMGNTKAGMPLKQALTQKNTPAISSSLEEVLPNVYLADVRQNNFKEENQTVRSACIFLQANSELKPLAIDIIPNDWPEQPYKGKPFGVSIVKAMGLYSIFINLGTGTFFTAIGIFIASVFGLGIRVDSIQTLYKAAFVLGLVESLVYTILPAYGFLLTLAVETIALGISSIFIEGFKVNWSDGYRVVAFGAGVIVGIRGILQLLLFNLIYSLI